MSQLNGSSVMDEEKGLNRTQTAVTMSPELFEKLYLTPKVPHAGNNIKRFANPTPLGFMGFVIAGFSFSMILMGWGGASGAQPIVGIFFFGAMLLIVASIFEWIMGNFFSMLTMGVFGVFWLSFGLLLFPTLNLTAPYVTADDPTGLASPAWNAGLALFLIVWGFVILTLTIFTLKINVVFVVIYCILIAFSFVMSGCYWRLSHGDVHGAAKLQKAAGALLFAAAALGWYITTIIIAGEMRFPLPLPVGDLSHLWPETNVALADDKRD
ncbi:hypothetical protein HMPREF1624_04228 [Sporothrix schenckii ATCC 58251]|uniref:GPR1/FUN34/YaaH-class plasma membrane protein n=2 Tax=Sporothrix schenckii TaxID=29908 RepID=U7PTT2_SPOS1|nr:hypothetical protein HMPREF1624_04228 [Sporothrix schenckii ATCC 58251]